MYMGCQRVKETHAVSLNKVTNNQMKEIAHPIQRTLNSTIRRAVRSWWSGVFMVRGGDDGTRRRAVDVSGAGQIKGDSN